MVLPLARETELVVQDLSDETLVYDLERDRAYCLNGASALVWRNCDGLNSVEELARILERELGIPADEDVVWLALKGLQKAHLLQERVIPRWLESLYTRRQVLRKMGLFGAAVLLPVIITVVAPTATQAATCVTSCAGLPLGQPCSPPDCTNICCGADPPKRKCRPPSHPSCA